MKYYSTKSQRGLTLIELMIAIVLGLFLTAGLIQLFVNSNQSYRVQENLSRLQENGRFAMEFMSRDLRSAGYWGCIKDPTIIKNISSPDFNHFTDAVLGTNDDGLNGSDSITISGAASSKIFVEDPTSTTSLKVTDDSGLSKNNVVLVSDGCFDGDIVKITNDPKQDNDNLTLDPALSKLYEIKTQVFQARVVTYSISDGQNKLPALFRSVNGVNNELIEGIENMQILYGEDTDNLGDPDYGSPNYYVPANEVDGGSGHMDKVVSIRISLVAATLDDNLAIKDTDPPTDRRIRRVFTSTIALRNRLIN